MKILLIVISIIAVIGLMICSMALGWCLCVKRELEQEKGGHIILDGDVSADHSYYYVRILESDGVFEHLRIPRGKHTLNVSGYQRPVEIIIKNW